MEQNKKHKAGGSHCVGKRYVALGNPQQAESFTSETLSMIHCFVLCNAYYISEVDGS